MSMIGSGAKSYRVMVVGRSGKIGKNFPRRKPLDRWLSAGPTSISVPFPCHFPSEVTGCLLELHRDTRAV